MSVWDVTPPNYEEPTDQQIFEWMANAFQLAADYHHPDGMRQKQWYQLQADMFAELTHHHKERLSNEDLVKKMFGEL